MQPQKHEPQPLSEIPIVFALGLCRYTISDPLPSWRLLDGQPRCDECNKSLNLNSWGSPPHAGLASCACIKERPSDWCEVVQIGGATPQDVIKVKSAQ